MMAGTSGRADRDVPARYCVASGGEGGRHAALRTRPPNPGPDYRTSQESRDGLTHHGVLACDCWSITKAPHLVGLFCLIKGPCLGWTIAGRENARFCPPCGQKRFDRILIQKLFYPPK